MAPRFFVSVSGHGYASVPEGSLYLEGMYMRWYLLLICLIVTPALGEGAYRWVDENGVIHYSDVPHPGAELIDLGEVQTFSAPQAPAAAPSDRPASNGSDAALAEDPYPTFRISQPSAEQTLRDNSGTLDIALDVEPRIKRGHFLELFLDGTSVEGIPRATTRFTIGGVVRGEHTLRAALVDGAGNVVAETPTVRFFVMQTSIQNQANPLAPGNQPRPTPPIARPRPRG